MRHIKLCCIYLMHFIKYHNLLTNYLSFRKSEPLDLSDNKDIGWFCLDTVVVISTCLFIAVCQHVPHTVHQKGELGPLLELLVPTLPHDLITTRETTPNRLGSFLYSKQEEVLKNLQDVGVTLGLTRPQMRGLVWPFGSLSSRHCKRARSWAGQGTVFLLPRPVRSINNQALSHKPHKECTVCWLYSSRRFTF